MSADPVYDTPIIYLSSTLKHDMCYYGKMWSDPYCVEQIDKALYCIVNTELLDTRLEFRMKYSLYDVLKT